MIFHPNLRRWADLSRGVWKRHWRVGQGPHLCTGKCLQISARRMGPRRFLPGEWEAVRGALFWVVPPRSPAVGLQEQLSRVLSGRTLKG